MDLLASHRGECHQELVDCRTLIDILEQRRYRKARTPETPNPAQLAGIAVNNAAETPIHIFSLSPFTRWAARSRARQRCRYAPLVFGIIAECRFDFPPELALSFAGIPICVHRAASMLWMGNPRAIRSCRNWRASTNRSA